MKPHPFLVAHSSPVRILQDLPEDMRNGKNEVLDEEGCGSELFVRPPLLECDDEWGSKCCSSRSSLRSEPWV